MGLTLGMVEEGLAEGLLVGLTLGMVEDGFAEGVVVGLTLGTVEEGTKVRVAVGLALGVVVDDGFDVGIPVEVEGLEEDCIAVGTMKYRNELNKYSTKTQVQ